MYEANTPYEGADVEWEFELLDGSLIQESHPGLLCTPKIRNFWIFWLITLLMVVY